MKANNILAFGLLFGLIASSASATENNESSESIVIQPIVQARPQVLIAGIGGWKSCLGQANDQYISNRFLTLISNLRRCRPDLDISYVMYCSPGLKAKSGDGEVRVYGRFGTSMVAEKLIGASIEQHKVTPDTKVFVMGHSHGGWMAMRAALCLGHVDGLYTMEPVSAMQCTTADYLKNRTRKIFVRRQQIVPGCRRAPTDVDRFAVAQAAGGNWTNFFLAPNTEKGDVYSSPIAEANNHMIWAPAEGKFNAHHNLGMSATTWGAIESGILGSLSVTTTLPMIQDVGPASVLELPIEVPNVSAPSILDDQAADSPPSSFQNSSFPKEVRVWSDHSGQHSRTASIYDLHQGIAVLKLQDGKLTEVELNALSDSDQEWIAQHTSVSLASNETR